MSSTEMSAEDRRYSDSEIAGLFNITHADPDLLALAWGRPRAREQEAWLVALRKKLRTSNSLFLLDEIVAKHRRIWALPEDGS